MLELRLAPILNFPKRKLYKISNRIIDNECSLIKLTTNHRRIICII